MAELRRDPLTGRWVILSPGRLDRPGASDPGPSITSTPSDEAPVADCPFCPGHESQTPPEVARRGAGDPDGPGWHVRVVPNRYPIVDGATGEVVTDGDDLRQRRSAGGVHEVVVLSPAHHRSLAQLTDGEVLEVLLAVQDRVRVHTAAGHRYVQAMVNHGPEAGASLAHPHAQLVALDVTAPAVDEEVAHVVEDGRCVMCREIRLLEHDLRRDATDRDAVLWCPWWSSTAYELLLAPREHGRRFEDAGPELEALAATLRRGLARLGQRLEDPPYNLMIHTLPADRHEDYHWHIHIRPRLRREAGFEIGTGILVNSVDPDRAAERLR